MATMKALLAAAPGAILLHPAHAQQLVPPLGYHIIELDAPTNDQGEGYDINESGEVAGSIDPNNDGFRPCLWAADDPEGGRNLGDLPGQAIWGRATGLNNSGDVCGFFLVEDGYGVIGFTWRDGVYHRFDDPAFGASYAEKISDTGYIAGYAVPFGEPMQACVWAPGSQGRVVPPFGQGQDIEGHAYDINSAGRAVGWLEEDESHAWAFITTSSDDVTPIRLEGIDGENSFPNAINELDHVVGFVEAPGTFAQIPFIWKPGKGMTRLPVSEANPTGEPMGLNNRGLVVGRGQFEPVVWDASGVHALRPLIVPEEWAAWAWMAVARAVNDAGQITGYGSLKKGGWRAFRLDPIWCPGDVDASGSRDLFDFLAFVNRFNGGDSLAECTGDGVLDLFDFLCFVNDFNSPCP